MVLTEASHRAGKRKATSCPPMGHDGVLRAAAGGVFERVEDEDDVVLHERAGVGVERAFDTLRALSDTEHAEAGGRQQHHGRQHARDAAPERVTPACAMLGLLRGGGCFRGLWGLRCFRAFRSRGGFRLGSLFNVCGFRRGRIGGLLSRGLVFVHEELLSQIVAAVSSMASSTQQASAASMTGIARGARHGSCPAR